MELSGRIKLIKDTQKISDRFSKREFVLSTEEGEHSQHISMEFTQDKCDLLDNYKAGEAVTVAINIRGREWTGKDGIVKHFNTIQAWKISGVAGEAVSSGAPVNEEVIDDLPF